MQEGSAAADGIRTAISDALSNQHNLAYSSRIEPCCFPRQLFSLSPHGTPASFLTASSGRASRTKRTSAKLP